MTGGPNREAPRGPAGDAPGEAPRASTSSTPSEAPRVSASDAPSEPLHDPGSNAPSEAPRVSTGGIPGDPPGGPPGQPLSGGQGIARRGGGNPERGYLIAAAVVKPLMRTWFRIRLEGEEHIPEAGPVILASNHRSNMDPVLLASAVRRPVAFMAKAELFVGPLGWIMRWIGQFPVRRGGIDREALRRTDAILARGSMLGLFPEGTRGDGGFSAVHPGLAYIVVRQRCPVLPVAIFGTERVRRRLGWLPFASPVRIVIGPAIDLPKSTSDRAGRRAASELLRQRLQAFLAVAGGGPTAQSTSSQSDE
jgi:1-acyl-sn-glycerol-3-phosphate acyltransferase